MKYTILLFGFFFLFIVGGCKRDYDKTMKYDKIIVTEIEMSDIYVGLYFVSATDGISDLHFYTTTKMNIGTVIPLNPSNDISNKENEDLKTSELEVYEFIVNDKTFITPAFPSVADCILSIEGYSAKYPGGYNILKVHVTGKLPILNINTFEDEISYPLKDGDTLKFKRIVVLR